MLKRIFPILAWGVQLNRATLGKDLMAALVVAVMLIPQAMAYAMLAGLPPQAGLYASLVPLLLYGVFGTSRTLAVGPVAVVSLMTAVAISEVSPPGSADYHLAALTLALLSGAFMVLMGLLRLGFLTQLLSHPVISAFISAAAILIAGSQVRHLLGITTTGKTLPELLPSVAANLSSTNVVTLALASAVLVFLLWSRRGLATALRRLGLAADLATLLGRSALLVAVLLSTLAVWALDLPSHGVSVVGAIPRGLPSLSRPEFSWEMLQALALPATMIALIGFVESISIAKTLAAKRRQHLDPDRELIALGAANFGAAFTGAMPVTGGLSRSMVNFDAGAQTPAAGLLTALTVALVLLFLTPLLYFLPQATLAAIIIVAVLALLDLETLRHTWRLSKADGAAMVTTFGVTLTLGVAAGLLAGVGLSVLLHLFFTTRPHIARLGQVAGTAHYRNVDRHALVTAPHVLALRVDESLYFPNVAILERRIGEDVAAQPELTDVVLVCAAINTVDASAVESLMAINQRLASSGLRFHLAEVKGPVMDRLQRSPLLQALSGQVFLCHHDAMQALAPEITATADTSPRCAHLQRTGTAPQG